MLSDKAKENKNKYISKYHKEKYKRIPLDVTLQKYDEIKQAAETSNEKINTYIKKAIDERLYKNNQ